MPVRAGTPEPIKSAIEEMESRVQSTKQSLAFAAPEMQDTFWIALQIGLADLIVRTIERAQANVNND